MLEHRSAAYTRTAPEQDRGPVTHELKCWTTFFTEIAEGRKRHDLRRTSDRNFQVGDHLLLREFDPLYERYTGREQLVRVSYITSANLPCALSKEALHPDFCILSIALTNT